MNSSTELREIAAAARPLIETWLDTAERMAALRDAATAKGFDWSQIKALIKAQIQDERDGKDRVRRLLEKADHAIAYAGMLGLVNEKNFSAVSHDPETGEVFENARGASNRDVSAGQSQARPDSLDGKPAHVERASSAEAHCRRGRKSPGLAAYPEGTRPDAAPIPAFADSAFGDPELMPDWMRSD